MIKSNPKQCSVCGKISPLWQSTPPQCKECSQKQKIARKPPNKARKPIKKVSDKQAKLNALYSILATHFKKDHLICEARIKCNGLPTIDIHHVRGRGEYLLDSTTFLAVCRTCHRWIEGHPLEAKGLGLSKSRLGK